MSKVTDGLTWFFDKFLPMPQLALVLSAAFAVIVISILIINATCGNMARVITAERKAKRFFKKNNSIDYHNAHAFKKKCIAVLPHKIRKIWRHFESDGTPIQNTRFEPSLRECVAKGGTIGFGLYLYYYIMTMIVLVVGMMFSSIPQEITSIYVCMCLVAGAVGLFVLGLQLYLMDRRSSKKVDYIVREVYSKMLIFKPKSVSQIMKTAPYFNQVALTNVNKISDNSAKIGTFANIERINSELAAKNYPSQVVIAPAEDIDVITPDAIGRLNVLIDNIIGDGISESALKNIHDALLAVYETRFSRPIDDLRMKCIIRKLNAV